MQRFDGRGSVRDCFEAVRFGLVLIIIIIIIIIIIRGRGGRG